MVSDTTGYCWEKTVSMKTTRDGKCCVMVKLAAKGDETKLLLYLKEVIVTLRN